MNTHKIIYNLHTVSFSNNTISFRLKFGMVQIGSTNCHTEPNS